MASYGEVNPYAAPQHYGYQERSDSQVGVWRDGRWLVLHEDASLPPVCVKTGEPAELLYPYKIQWCYSIDWSMRTLRLQLPLTRRAHRSFVHGRRSVVLGSMAPMVAIALAAMLRDAWAEGPVFAAILILAVMGVAFAVACGIASIAIPELLRFKRARNGYLWLAGADARFLEGLPPWAGR